jgi:2-polyprenyl-3-methyl-5-hydroxy-6-metoxy-1,4-benzoquinol methylase
MSEPSVELSAANYNQFWQEWPDFVKFHPGSRHRRRLVLESIHNLSFQSVLDVGCGTGELLGLMQKEFQGKKLTGADYSPAVIGENKRKYPTVDFFVIDLPRATVDRQFDLVLCSEVIEHIDDQKNSFLNLAKLVKPGGHLCITCPTGKIHNTEKHFGHVRHPKPEELEEFAKLSGLKVVHFFVWGWPTYNLLKWATNVNDKWAIKNFSTGKYDWKKRWIANLLYLANFFNLAHFRKGTQIVALFQKPQS